MPTRGRRKQHWAEGEVELGCGLTKALASSTGRGRNGSSELSCVGLNWPRFLSCGVWAAPKRICLGQGGTLHLRWSLEGPTAPPAAGAAGPSPEGALGSLAPCPPCRVDLSRGGCDRQIWTEGAYPSAWLMTGHQEAVAAAAAVSVGLWVPLPRAGVLELITPLSAI